MPSCRGSSQPRDQTHFSHIVDSLPAEQPGNYILMHQFSSGQLLSHVRLFATPWTTAHQASLFITNSRSSLKLTSIESVIPSSHLILCHPLFLLPPNPSQHQSLFPGVNSSHEVAKVLEFITFNKKIKDSYSNKQLQKNFNKPLLIITQDNISLS